MPAPLNIHDEIQKNKRKTFLILSLFPIVFAGLVFLTVLVFYLIQAQFASPAERAFDSQSSIAFAGIISGTTIVIALVWTVIAWYRGDQIVLRSADAHEISRRTFPEIYVLVENLTIATGLPLPRIYIIDDESLNAFATGRDPQHASLALTKGIIKRLNRAELEGVIGHELGHIANHDIRLTMLVATSIGVVSLIGQILVQYALRGNRRSNSKGNGTIILLMLGIVFILYGAVFAPLISLALSRRREYQADATSAYMTRNPLALASALEKISGDSRVEVLDGKAAIGTACIAFPGDTKALVSSLFATHPPIKDRIAKLRNM